jgi:hypothetical protein
MHQHVHYHSFVCALFMRWLTRQGEALTFAKVSPLPSRHGRKASCETHMVFEADNLARHGR